MICLGKNDRVKNVFTLIVCVSLTVFSMHAFGWSAKGHSAIGVAAFFELDEATRKRYVAILQSGPWNKKQNVISAEALVRSASSWPDRIRSKTLSELFAQAGSGQVPSALKSYAAKDTKRWHYVNALFLAQDRTVVSASSDEGASVCPPKRYGELFNVWPLLFEAYQQSTDKRDKAIVLAFVLHLGADAYQPLHVFSALDAQCQHDFGGNAFCLDPPLGLKAGFKKCKQKLHQVWDRGFGFFEQQLASTHAPVFRGNTHHLENVLSDLRPYFIDVYPKSAHTVSDQSYQANAQKVVAKTSLLATSHLRASLAFLEKQ